MDFGTFSIEISYSENNDGNSTNCDFKIRVESTSNETDYIEMFHEEIFGFFQAWFPNMLILFENKSMSNDTSLKSFVNNNLMSEHPLIGEFVKKKYYFSFFFYFFFLLFIFFIYIFIFL